MYEKKSQNFPIGQFLINKIGRYSAKTKKIRVNNFTNSLIKDEKQIKLYVAIMETLAMDNERLQQIKREKKERKRKWQSKCGIRPKIQPNFERQHSQDSEIEKPKSEDDEDDEDEVAPLDAMGLAGEEGLKKLQGVTSIIVAHCDKERTTKDVHKVLYLVLKYLQFRIKTKEGFKQLMRRKTHKKGIVKGNAGNDQIQEKDDIVRLLSDACSLFWDDLKNIPVVIDPKSNKKKQAKQAKQKGGRSKGKQKSDPVEGSLSESSSQLAASNPYYYLISLLETQQLQKLATSLQFEIRTLNVELDNNQQGGQNLNEVRGYLVGKLESVTELVLRRVYSKRCVQEYSSFINKPLLITSFIKKSQKNSESSFKWVEFEQEKVPQLIYQKYAKLVIALKYITSILLGNEKTIALYSGANIYLYLALYMLYVDRTEKEEKKIVQGDEMGEEGRKMRKVEASSNGEAMKKGRKQKPQERSVFDLQKFKEIAEQYLEKYFKVSLRGSDAKNELNLSHKLILQLFSLPLDSNHPYKHHPQTSRRLLAFHYFFQNTISYFVGYQFYAYLIITIVFSLGLVNKQLHSIDAEYESNIMGELLMNTVSEVKGLVEAGKAKGLEDIREVDEYSVWNDEVESNGQAAEGKDNKKERLVDSVEFSGEDNIEDRNYANSIELRPREQLTKKSRLLMVPLLTLKLLLCTTSYYKHVIMRQKVQKQYYLTAVLEDSPDKRPPKDLISSMLGYGRLPLHQAIENLISSSFMYEKINTYELVDWLKGLAKYACRFHVEEYILEYIKNLIIISMDSGGSEKLNSFDKYILELMALEVKICIISYHQVYRRAPPTFSSLVESLPHHQTYTLNLFISNYLLEWTLTCQFTYSLLDKVRELTGTQSELRKLSSPVADQFCNFFAVYLKLEVITKRGKCVIEPVKDYVDKASNFVRQKKKQRLSLAEQKVERRDQNLRKINQMQRRLDSLEQILCSNSLEGCGQVLRVAWQVIEDYHEVKTQMTKQILFATQIQQELQKMANKAVSVVECLRVYMTAMQDSNYISEEFTKFKTMLF